MLGAVGMAISSIEDDKFASSGRNLLAFITIERLQPYPKCINVNPPPSPSHV